jgi:hypothetical protein
MSGDSVLSNRLVADFVLRQGSLEFAEQDEIQTAFLKFHRENPHVYEKLLLLARQVKESGRKRYGIECLFARLRWHYDFEVRSEEEFKLNNNYTSRYARLLMQQEKDLEGVFSVRELRRK